MAKRRALITGVNGQDGAYLAQFLLARDYQVFGTVRSHGPAKLWRLDKLAIREAITLLQADACDQRQMAAALSAARPQEIYNLAGISRVSLSFGQPSQTAAVNALAVAQLLEEVRQNWPEARFFQASSSEMYGRAGELPQAESTAFHPINPYGAAKLYAHWLTATYREAYGLHASSGILFNHESPLRTTDFVSRKITDGLARIKLGLSQDLRLGNVDAVRDWGYAPEYVTGMWAMLQQSVADDYVLATGNSHSVRELVVAAAQALDIELLWSGEGKAALAQDSKSGRVLVRVNEDLYRPTDIDEVCGNPVKALKKLGWKTQIGLDQLIARMVEADMESLKS